MTKAGAGRNKFKLRKCRGCGKMKHSVFTNDKYHGRGRVCDECYEGGK